MKIVILIVFVFALNLVNCALSESKASKKEDVPFKPWAEVENTEAQNLSSALYDEGQQIGTITSKLLEEVSGMVASHSSADVFWVNNDSGDKARIYAIQSSGKLLATVEIEDAKSVDWEELGSGPGKDGKPALYIFDAGDNDKVRDDYVIYRVPEPTNISDQKITKDLVESFPFSYPDGHHDCEGIFVDPASGQIFLITKTYKGDCGVYTFPMPLRAGEKVVLEKVSGKHIKSIERLRTVTGATISPDGMRVAIRTYFGAFELEREKGKSLASIFDNEPTIIKAPLLKQAEAIAYSQDGKSILMTSEKIPAPIFQLNRK
jgi:hypothetical protein